MNLKALKLLCPKARLKAVEINPDAARPLAELIGTHNVFEVSILDYAIKEQVDLTFTTTVLIHIKPEMLDRVYEKLYQASSCYVLVCEYYNTSPATISYRGYSGRLFKRDFAGEILDKYSDLRLIDYGFV